MSDGYRFMTILESQVYYNFDNECKNVATWFCCENLLKGGYFKELSKLEDNNDYLFIYLTISFNRVYYGKMIRVRFITDEVGCGLGLL